MYPKSLWEKIGDLLSHPGKRFLLGLLSIPLLWPFGVIIALSILDSRKTFFEGNVYVRMPNGEVIPCALVRVDHYAYMPLAFFVSPFWYFPYKSEYILLKHTYARNIPKGQRVQATVTTGLLVRKEQVTKAKAMAMQLHPEILASELPGQVERAREAFLQKAKPFFDTGLMETVFENRYCAVYRFEGYHILSFFAQENGVCCGLFVKEKVVELLRRDPSEVFNHLLTADPDRLEIIKFNDKVLERLLREKEKEQPETVNAPAMEREMSRMEEQKKLVTRQEIQKSLMSKNVSTKKLGGWGLGLLALGGLELGIFGLVGGMVVMGLIFAALGVWALMATIRQFKKGKRNKELILSGQYRIIKTTCAEVQEKLVESDDGNYTEYTTIFADGAHVQGRSRLGIQGDPFYLVYLAEMTQPTLVYNGVECRISPDIIVS